MSTRSSPEFSRRLHALHLDLLKAASETGEMLVTGDVTFAGGYKDSGTQPDTVAQFQALDRKSQMDIVHCAIFGWPLDHLSPTDTLLNSASLQEAAHKLLGTERVRFHLREAVPLWATDKWVCVDFNDLKIWVNLADSYVARGVIEGDWENQEVGFVLDHLNAGDAMVDVGANVGVYTLQAARQVGSEGRVYAFEPQADTFSMLKRSVGDNGFSDRVVIDNCALGDEDGAASIWRHHANNPGASIIVQGDFDAGSATSLKRLDSIAFDRKIALLKMDIEGYEPLLVAGGMRFFAEHRPIIVSEWFPRSIAQVARSSSAAYFAQLTDLGYAVHLLEGRNLGERLSAETLPRFDDVTEPFNIACMPA